MVGKGFLDCPTIKTQRAAEKIKQGKLELFNQKPETLHRVTMIGEIVSAVGFQSSSTYVSFQMLLPEEGWQFEDQNEFEKAMALD